MSYAYPPPGGAPAARPTYVVGGSQPMSIPIPSGGAPAAGGRRRTAAAAGLEGDHDFLEFTPLGSGCEVGRSCHILKFKGITIMLDCGLHPAYVGVSSLPFFDEIDPASIDLLLVSHFHLDHAAALPYFLTKTDFRGKCAMTHPTKSIYKLILSDYVKVSHLAVEDVLYTEQDLLASMDRIDVINFHESVHHAGIKFTAYNAGHVLGAAMFLIEIAGVRILYTGDYSRREDRHLMSAELPPPEQCIDVLIVEATYGIQRLPPVAEREQRFTDLVRDIVEVRRGKALLPVFALGRAQELLLILDEYWMANPQLHSIPVYYASALAKKCHAVYETYLNMMNRRIQMAAQVSNPFQFKHIFNLKGGANMDALDDDAMPCVVMASPGMLQNGLSRELLEMWAGEPANGVVLTGYCVEGTLAKHILTEPEMISTMNGGRIPLRASVSYISFSAHADFTETSEFVDILRPAHIILVHGDASEGVGRLRYALEARFRDDALRIVAPRNCQTVQLQFRAHKVAKAVGMLAARPPSQGQLLSGILVRKNFVDFTLMAPSELSTFTSLQSTTVQQSLKVPFHQTFECLKHFVGQMYDLDDDSGHDEAAHAHADALNGADEHRSDTQQEGKEFTVKSEVKDEKKPLADDDATALAASSEEGEASAAAVGPAVPSLTVHNSVRVSLHSSPSPHVLLEWASNPVSDMLSDSLIALMANIQSNPGMARVIGAAGGCRNANANGHTHRHGGCSHAHAAEQAPRAAAEAAAASAAASAADGSAEALPAFSGSSADAAFFAPVLKGSLPASPLRSPSFAWFLQQHYGPDIAYDAVTGEYRFSLNEVACAVRVSHQQLHVECADPQLRARIRAMVRRAHAAVHPIATINTARADDEQEERKQTIGQQQQATQQQADMHNGH